MSLYDDHDGMISIQRTYWSRCYALGKLLTPPQADTQPPPSFKRIPTLLYHTVSFNNIGCIVHYILHPTDFAILKDENRRETGVLPAITTFQ